MKTEQHTDVVIRTVTHSRNTPSRLALEFVGLTKQFNTCPSFNKTNP